VGFFGPDAARAAVSGCCGGSAVRGVAQAVRRLQPALVASRSSARTDTMLDDLFLLLHRFGHDDFTYPSFILDQMSECTCYESPVIYCVLSCRGLVDRTARNRWS